MHFFSPEGARNNFILNLFRGDKSNFKLKLLSFRNSFLKQHEFVCFLDQERLVQKWYVAMIAHLSQPSRYLLVVQDVEQGRRRTKIRCYPYAKKSLESQVVLQQTTSII